MAIRRIIINEDDIDNITTLLNNMDDSISFHSTSSCNEPNRVYYDFNITNQLNMPSIFKNISGTAIYCRDHSWTEPPPQPSGPPPV